VHVRPHTAVVVGELPPMAGRLVPDGDDVCFVPRFAFVEGTAYTVVVEGVEAAVLLRPRPDREATTEVLDIRPTATEVPRNLLRLYVWFSAPMSEGCASGHVRDARGIPLRVRAERRYDIGVEERRRVEPDGWALTVPSSGAVEPLEVVFERPLDHGLLARCLHVVGPDGRRIDGTAEVGPEERSWRLAPRQAWAPGSHRLVVDPVLEDLAGNSVSRVFDRDLTRPQDDPREARPFEVTFRPRLGRQGPPGSSDDV
jgi:hypothetical protein